MFVIETCLLAKSSHALVRVSVLRVRGSHVSVLVGMSRVRECYVFARLSESSPAFVPASV